MADGTDYGQIEIGSSVVHTFQLLNTGTSSLNITFGVVSGSPGVIAGLAGLIPAGGSDEFTITITARAPGPLNLPVTISSNDSSEPLFTFNLTFEGIALLRPLAITNMEIAGRNVQLTFVSVPDRTYRTYRISATTNVTTGHWVSAPYLPGLSGDSNPQT